MSTSRLRPFGPEIWLADGGQAQVAGFRYPTRMAVVRLTGGGLLVWSPVGLDDDLAAELAVLGEVAVLVAPNSLHDLHLAQWRSAFPTARLYAAPGVAAKRADLRIDVELGAAPPGDWPADLDYVLMAGNAITTEAVFFHRPSRTVLFTDLLQQFPPGWFTGWRALVARLDLMTQPQPRCRASSGSPSPTAAPLAPAWRAFSTGRATRWSWPTEPRWNGTAAPSSPAPSVG